MTLDQWFELNLPDLKDDLLVNFEGMGVKDEDIEGLLRVTMISIRDHVDRKYNDYIEQLEKLIREN